MRRLGYTEYVAQGGDWGAIITDLLAVEAPPELLGIHSNMPGAVPPAGPPRPRPRLVREHEAVRERTLEITFLEPGAEAYVFTFG
jgi:hypothetical protein